MAPLLFLFSPLRPIFDRQDALSDPAVQAEILKVAKEKFPEALF